MRCQDECGQGPVTVLPIIRTVVSSLDAAQTAHLSLAGSKAHYHRPCWPRRVVAKLPLSPISGQRIGEEAACEGKIVLGGGNYASEFRGWRHGKTHIQSRRRHPSSLCLVQNGTATSPLT